MSASPADRTPGQTPNGGSQPRMRRPKAADPLVRPKDRRRRVDRPQVKKAFPETRPNGATIPGPGQTQAIPQQLGKLYTPASRDQARPPPIILDDPDAVSGFSSPAIAPYIDYPLVMTKKSIMEGLRYHVARFASKKTVDPTNQGQFLRPVRLQRRDPRAPAFSSKGKEDEDLEIGDSTIDAKEIEKQEMLKAERDALRDAEMAQVAPSANTGGQKKVNAFKKKTQQIFRNDKTEEQKAESKLRYEESIPWHLEDFDGKQVWVGSYEAALSETYAMLAQGQDGTFRMMPLEKWYKFTPKNHFKTLTIEEAELRMGKKVKDPRWFMDSQQASKEKQTEQENKKATRGLFLGKWEKGAGGGGSAAPKTKQEQADADDLDFEEDRFADDEENILFEGEDEETKQAEARIKRDQLQANVFDLKEEKEYDKAEQEEKKERDAEKKLGKGVKKALMKREKNYIYDSDSADNPYSEQSESEDTETERLKEEQRKKEEDRKSIASDQEKGKNKKASGSGASSRGTNTPSHRPGKHAEPLKRTPSSSNLKRPGSPNLSEASGTETSRKKQKKQHAVSSSQPVHPQSRATSPSLAPPPSSALTESTRPALANSRKSSSTRLPNDALKVPDIPKPSGRPDGKRARSHAGSGSENDVAGSGGEMSDGTRKKLKLNFARGANKNGSVPASRAGSPEIRGADAAAKGGQGTIQAAIVTSIADAAPFPTAAELRAKIPPQGIKVGELLAHFKGQVVGEERKQRFTNLMRENSRYDRGSKLLKPVD